MLFRLLFSAVCMPSNPYQQSMQQSRSAPVEQTGPALVVILNYPSSRANTARLDLRNLLALYVPVYALFTPQRRLRSDVVDNLSYVSYDPLEITTFKDSILAQL